MADHSHHKDPSGNWLIFFFVCFGLTVFAIGVFALFTYKVDEEPKPEAGGGHHGMLPREGDYARHLA